MNDKSIMFWTRLPARLDVQQVAAILGFMPHEISVLMSVGFLRPLGKPAANGHKFFCSKDVVELSENKDWLDKATRAIAKHWQERNSKAVMDKAQGTLITR